MAELKNNTAMKHGIKPQTEFAEEHGNLTLSALDYAMDNDLIDYTRMGKVRFVVLTKKTLAYEPNKSSKRKKAILQT